MNEVPQDTSYTEDMPQILERLAALRDETPYPELDVAIVRQEPGAPESDFFDTAIVAADSRTGNPSDNGEPQEVESEAHGTDEPHRLSDMDLGNMIVDVVLDREPSQIGDSGAEVEVDEADVVAPGELLSPREFEALAARLGSVASTIGPDQLREDIERTSTLSEDIKRLLQAAIDETFPRETAQDQASTDPPEEDKHRQEDA